MKRRLLDILFGIIIVIVVTALEFAVTLPFGAPEVSGFADYASLISMELLLTALPAALTTFIFAWLLKTRSRSDAVLRSAIWTAALALYYFLIGIGNGNLREIFGTPGVYALLICAFAGPLVFALIKRLK